MSLSVGAYPALIRSALRYKDADGYFWVGYPKNWVRFRTQASDLNAVFALLDGSHSLEAIWEKAHAIAPRLSREQLSHMLHTLARKGLLVAGNPVLPPELEAEPAYLERHSRDLEFYAFFEKNDASRYDYLARVKAASVAVIGLGGIGSWLSLSLACSGIGELVGVDFDKVEISNLTRQILYTPADLDRAKGTAARAFFARFSPEMHFSSHSIKIGEPGDMAPFLENVDFVVLAADWPFRRISRWVNQACVEASVPALYVSASPSHIRVGPLVIPGLSSCYECFYRQREQHETSITPLVQLAQQEDWSADPTPALAPIPALAGHMLCWEALCALSGIQHPSTLGHILLLDLATFGTKRLPIEKQPTCPVCAMFSDNERAADLCNL